MSKYKLIALVGKSGSGKDTLLKEMLKIHNFNHVTAYTTRPMREGEPPAAYNFVSIEEFQKLNLIEVTHFNDWFYGTTFDSLDEKKINIGIFNPHSIKMLQAHDNIDLKIIKIDCPDKILLMRCLQREKEPNCNEICRRFLADKKDFKMLNSIDIYYLFENVGNIKDGASKLVKFILDKIYI